MIWPPSTNLRSTHLLAGLEWRDGVVLLYRKGLYIEVRTIFINSKGKLVVLDVSKSEGGTFRLVAVNAPTGAGRQISSDIWKLSFGHLTL